MSIFFFIIFFQMVHSDLITLSILVFTTKWFSLLKVFLKSLKHLLYKSSLIILTQNSPSFSCIFNCTKEPNTHLSSFGKRIWWLFVELFRRNCVIISRNSVKFTVFRYLQLSINVRGSFCVGLAGFCNPQSFRAVGKCFLFSMIFMSMTTFCCIERLFKDSLTHCVTSPLFTTLWMLSPPLQFLICHVTFFFSVLLSNHKKTLYVPEASPVSIETSPFDLELWCVTQTMGIDMLLASTTLLLCGHGIVSL